MTATSPSPSTSTPRSTPNILMFGELLADCFPDREIMGGAPFNVARHLLGLGRPVGLDPVLVTRVGKDARGGVMMDALRDMGLSIDGIQQDLLHPTGQVLVTMNGDTGGHQFEIVPDQAWDFVHADMARLIGLLYRPQWIYFGTLAQRAASKTALRTLMLSTHARGFFDVNLRDPWLRKDVLRWSLDKAEVVKVNEEELHRIAELLGIRRATSEVLGERLIRAFGIRQLLVTDGDRGAWLLDADNRRFHTGQSGAQIQVVDTVGAGDAFSAVFLFGLTQHWPIADSLARAHHFAGRICGIRGAIPDNDDFYQPFREEWRIGKSTLQEAQ